MLTAEAYELSGRLCGTCRDLHALWPYIRLSRASTGIEVQASKLESRLGDLFARGLRRLLIAGSADTGLLALAARAGADHGVNIVVLDICETPLELCRTFCRTKVVVDKHRQAGSTRSRYRAAIRPRAGTRHSAVHCGGSSSRGAGSYAARDPSRWAARAFVQHQPSGRRANSHSRAAPITRMGFLMN